jgi:hypothetical protein
MKHLPDGVPLYARLPGQGSRHRRLGSCRFRGFLGQLRRPSPVQIVRASERIGRPYAEMIRHTEVAARPYRSNVSKLGVFPASTNARGKDLTVLRGKLERIGQGTGSMSPGAVDWGRRMFLPLEELCLQAISTPSVSTRANSSGISIVSCRALFQSGRRRRLRMTRAPAAAERCRCEKVLP